MKFFTASLILILACFSFLANAQSKLYKGGWKVSDSQTFTRITAQPLDSARIFRLSNIEIVDGNVAQFRVNADGTSQIIVVEEGGSVFVEAQSVSVTQRRSGTYAQGIWEIVNDSTPHTSLSWKFFPQTNSRITVASFKQDRTFVVSLNSSTIGCSNGTMVVFVDGEPVKDDRGRTLNLLAGSSIIGTGKVVEIKASGTCSTGDGFMGSLSFAR